MASITFGCVWLNRADDMANGLYLDGAVSVAGGVSKDVSTRIVAGGRIRVVTRPGTVGSVDVSKSYATIAEREWLEAQVGVLLLYRDGRRRKLWGVIPEVNADEITGGTLKICNVSFKFTEVTHSEEV